MTFSRINMDGSSPPSLWRRRLAVALILFAIVFFNILNILLTVRLTFCHNKQLQAINTISINVSAAHFSFDKILNGDDAIAPREVDALLRQARTEADLMLEIARESALHGLFHPRDFEGSLENLSKQLDAVTGSSRDSLRGVATGEAAVLAGEANRNFREANQAIDATNTLLWQAIANEQGFFFKVQIFLTILSVILALLTIYFLYRYDLVRKRSLEISADQRNQEQFIAQFSRFCRDTAAIEPVYELVTSWIAGQLGIDRVSVWRFDESGAALVCRCLYDSESKRFVPGGAEIRCNEIPRYSAALKRDEPIVAEDARSHPATGELGEDYLLPLDIRSMLDLPLKLNGEIAGVLCLEVRHNRRGWEAQEIALCRAVADQVSLAMGRTWERELREKEQAAYAARLEHEVRERTTELAAANESLQENETRLQLIFNKAPFGAALVDLYGHFLQVNEEFHRFTGYDEAELGAVNFLRLVQAESRAHYEESFSRLLAGEISKFRADSLYRQKEGESLWGRTTIRMLRDDAGNPLYFLLMVENISERKSYEDQLGKLHKAIEQSPLSILITDASGRIEYANPFFSSVTGYALAEVVGQNPRVLKSEAHEPEFYRNLWHTIKAGKTWQGEICNRKKDGSLFWEHAFIAPVNDKDGKIVSFIAVKEDISERKLLADELQERSEMIASIAAAALSAIIMIDDQGLISFWNKAAENIFGWNRGEVLGEDLHRLVAGNENRRQFLANFDQFRQTGTGPAMGRQVELTAVRKNGEKFPVEVSLSAIRIKGKWHAVGIVNDISERKEAQKSILIARDDAEAANRAKSDFLARMSHEIRTPMNAIIGLSELALEMDLSPKLRDYLGKISSSGKNLLCIINDILDFSKIEAKKLEIAPHPFSLEKILADLAGITTIRAEEKGLEFMFSVAPNVPDRLVGDATRLGQVLINLTSNAIKFTEQGEVILDITLQERRAEKLILRFSVRDTGMGMTEAQVGNLFMPFSQADGSISRNYGGTGLGLAICKRLVELMGGKFEVRSCPGLGSTFSFTVELAAQSEASESLQFHTNLRVLVVEDHPATREILRKALESFSFLVTDVDSGEKGLEEFQKAVKSARPFDLLLLDYRLPGISGEEVARAVRERQPSGGAPKILVLTSLGAAKIVEACLAAGCDGVIDKPVSRSGLFDAIIRLYGKKGAAGAAGTALTPKDALAGRLAGARILVVEDNQINQQVAREILQRAGVLVDIANNGEEALEAILKNEYELVLMDIQMPGMDGLQVTRIIRASGIRRLAALPIVAMTAHAIKGDEALSLGAGMNDHITKPIDANVLFAALGKWLPRKTAAAVPSPPQKGEPIRPEGLPAEIRGIDLELAMKRLGSAKLCTSVLRQFVEHYEGEADRIVEQMRNRRWDEAYRALHSLKGVVGTICAQELHGIVVALEKNCKEQQAPTGLLAAFTESHARLIEELQPLRVPTSDPVSPEPPPGLEVDSGRILEILLFMLPDVKEHRPVKCAAHVAELKKIPWPADRQNEIKNLIAAVENYQFKQAGRLIEQVISVLDTAGRQ
ncbi:PAS domain S-box protein [Thiovibrio sp. JS02]